MGLCDEEGYVVVDVDAAAQTLLRDGCDKDDDDDDVVFVVDDNIDVNIDINELFNHCHGVGYNFSIRITLCLMEGRFNLYCEKKTINVYLHLLYQRS